DLVGAFSLATDLGLGQPMEHVLRSWVIAGRLGGHLGVEPDDRGALYYSATLAWVGCVADTPELATWFGDDIAFRADSRRGDVAVGADEVAAPPPPSSRGGVGCAPAAPELAPGWADPTASRADSRRVDLAGPPRLGFTPRQVRGGSPRLHRIRHRAKLVATG